ncbi:TRAP transporter small permease [Roseobacter sp. HKCCA0434]|uniref:TRAP transporter small permease n=1 Tax=Roseobacter sp. HKCCA0434 TaxID=3079297 RepID=UPI002905D7BC|nr:TRAP transporter small permease subunit [Roseobacter sp. HKCCA0434]
MPLIPNRWRDRARHAAEAVPAIMLAAMFACFILQVFMRYVMNDPVGWTVEVCVISWLWILLWGQSVSASEADEIRFDIVYGSVGPGVRRWFRAIFATALVAIYLISLPALWDYVTFMRIEQTSYLDIPFNWVFSIALIFSVVSILRYAAIAWAALRGAPVPAAEAEPHAATRKDFTE